MPFQSEDHQRQDRRLRDRLPACRFPMLSKNTRLLVFVMTAMLSLTTASYANDEEEEIQPDMRMEVRADQRYYVIEYKREDLEKEPPANPTQSFGQRLLSEFHGFLERTKNLMTSGAHRKKLDALSTEEPAAGSYGLHIAAMKDPPKIRYSDGIKISQQFGKSLQQVVSDTTKSRVGLIDHFNAGMGFDLDLGTIFSRDKPKVNQNAKLRYGLILEDIEVTRKAPDRAAFGTDLSDLEFAGQADVVWTIGPLEEQQGQRIFNIKPAKDTGYSDSLWQRIRIPAPSFSGNIAPVAFGNLGELKDESNLPGWKAELRQSENYYVFTHVTDSKGEKQSEEHAFRVPILGTMEIGRRFDQDFHVIQTSAYNILIDERFPSLSAHYMNMEQRFVGSLNSVFDGHSLELSGSSVGSGTAPSTLAKAKHKAHMAERYGLKYSKRF